jgi:hypothetical protein
VTVVLALNPARYALLNRVGGLDARRHIAGGMFRHMPWGRLTNIDETRTFLSR